MTIACPGCGQPCSSRKKMCEDCRRKAELAEVFKENDTELQLQGLDTEVKLAPALPKLGSAEAKEAMDGDDAPNNGLTPQEIALLDGLMLQESRLFGSRIKIGRKNGGISREYIKSHCEAGAKQVIANVTDRYEKHGKPEFDSRQGCIAMMSYQEHFLVKSADNAELPTVVKGKPVLFDKGVHPAEAAQKALDSLFAHLPEVFSDCRPDGKYVVEVTLKWAWPTGNSFAVPMDQPETKPAETVH